MNPKLCEKLLIWLIPVVALLIIFTTLWLWAFKFEPESFSVNHSEVKLQNWHKVHNHLKIAVLADIHQRKIPDELQRLREIIKATNAEKPDIVVLLGDFIGRRFDPRKVNATPEIIAVILKDLQSNYGTYAVLGNHDWWHDGNAVRQALEEVGITVLENSYIPLTIHGEQLNIIGLPDRTTRHKTLDLSKLPDIKIPSIVLSHDPDYFEELELPYELMLAGHTHGGQVKLPWIGALITPSKYGTKYSEGWFERHGKKLFVTRGLGASIIRLRFLCPPEVAILNISRAEVTTTLSF